MTRLALTEFTLHLTNPGATPKTVILEPWTGAYRLPPNGSLDVVVRGTPSTPLEIQVEGETITVFAFETTDAMLTAYRDGRELKSE